ncbi:MAG: metallophosphoesterase [Rubricoccaceae bacterium]|nr:metallophosphoesterase [Rubricoccaceae bacterium]
MALYAIGDVHGCAATLDRLLDRLALTPDDRVVFIGDYVDRGPASPAVLDRLLQLEADAADGRGPGCVFLRGNHDQMMLDYVDGAPNAYELWRINGGMATLAGYMAGGRVEIPEAHIAFLERTPAVHEEGGFVFVHAGLDPRRSVAENLARPDPRVFLWTRAHLDADLGRWETPVVCGHTPQPEPLNRPNLINIDTGAVYHHLPGFGTLTAVRLPERTFVRVPYEG